MSNTITSSNMLLPIPVVGIDPGPDYALNIDSCLAIIDQHDHSNNNGARITPSGININNDLPLNGNSLTTVKKISYNSQSAALTGTNFLSVVSGNLYFNDGSGNQVQITSSGGVAGASGSISGLTAPASAVYSPGSTLFSWFSNSNQYAAMANGALTIYQTGATSPQGVTIQSVASLASSYTLTLPAALPGSNQYLTSSNTGALSFSSADTIGSAMTSTGANAIGSAMTSTGANAVLASYSTQNTTFTPTVTVNAGSITVTTNDCHYLTIGKMTMVFYRLAWNTFTSTFTQLTVTVPNTIASPTFVMNSQCGIFFQTANQPDYVAALVNTNKIVFDISQSKIAGPNSAFGNLSFNCSMNAALFYWNT